MIFVLMLVGGMLLSPFDTSRETIISCPVIIVCGTTQDDTIIRLQM